MCHFKNELTAGFITFLLRIINNYICTYTQVIHRSEVRQLHRLLLITIKRATMCMNQQRIKRRDMRVDGLVIELHATSIQYKNLNMPNHSLSCKCIQHQKINCQ